MWPIGSKSRVVLNQWTHSRTANSTSSRWRQAHQPLHGAAGHVHALASQRMPDLAVAVHVVVRRVDPLDVGLELLVAARPRRGRPGLVVVVGGRGELQHLTDRLDPELLTVIVDERDHHRGGRSSSAWAKYADALRKMSFARRSSHTSRRSAFNSSASGVVVPGRCPPSTSALRTHLRTHPRPGSSHAETRRLTHADAQ
jgi:hypothetical protein